MAFTEDLTPFFSDFATGATWGTKSILGLFDRTYSEPFGNLVAGSQITFICESIDIAGIAQGATLTIGGASFKVRGIEPDGSGVTMLRLEEQ